MTGWNGAYSLDDVLPPRKAQYIDGSPAAWMIVGHAIWGVALAWFAWVSSGVPWFALVLAVTLALGPVVALVLVMVAWASRTSRIAGARAVAWVSTPLLGIAVGLLAITWVGGAVLLTDDTNLVMARVSPVFGATLLGFVVVPLVILSVPTIGAFAAAVSDPGGTLESSNDAKCCPGVVHSFIHRERKI